MTINRIDQIQFLRGTAAAIAAENPIPYVGEPVFAYDTNVLKIGDGSTAYNSLSALGGGGGIPTQITVANEASDATCFPLFATAATGDLGPKTNAGLTFDSSTGVLTATGFSGPLTGNVTGNAATASAVAVGGITGLGANVATSLANAMSASGTLAILGANTFTALQTITQASANAGILASTGYSLTGSNATNMIDLAGTWNTSGNPVLIKAAITNTASGSTAKFLSFLAGASGTTEVVAIDKAGNLTLAAYAAGRIPYFTTGGVLTSDASFTTDTFGTVFAAAYNLNSFGPTWNALGGTVGSTQRFAFTDASAGLGTADVILRRIAAATLGLINSTNAQTLQLYGTASGTPGSDYVRLSLGGIVNDDGTTFSTHIKAETGGTGRANGNIVLTPVGSGIVKFNANAIFSANQGISLYNSAFAARLITIDNNGAFFSSAVGIKWNSDASDFNGSFDTGLFRNSAGIVEINNGSAATYRDLKLRNLVVASTLATNMTDGFINIGGAAGAPSGVPSITTGFPMYWDSTNLKLYIYTGGAWKSSAAFT